MWVQWLVYGIPDAPKASERVAAEAAELLLESETEGDWEAAMLIIRSRIIIATIELIFYLPTVLAYSMYIYAM
jgi:hypothetical protein